MLDPSLLLSRRTLSSVFEMAEAGLLEGVVIPRAFFEHAESIVADASAMGFYAANAPEAEGRPAALLDRIAALQRLQATAEIRPREDLFWPQLGGPGGAIDLILTEEWSFLNSHSWVLSRIKRPFREFVRAGAFAVEGGRQRLDWLLARPLKVEPSELTALMRLRGVAKWFAAGGTSFQILRHLAPHAEMLLEELTPIFLLLDP